MCKTAVHFARNTADLTKYFLSMAISQREPDYWLQSETNIYNETRFIHLNGESSL